jgi:intein-encoded DNA endonuclease-like protein
VQPGAASLWYMIEQRYIVDTESHHMFSTMTRTKAKQNTTNTAPMMNDSGELTVIIRNANVASRKKYARKIMSCLR